ncbi:peamaclein [Apium graveolens]
MKTTFVVASLFVVALVLCQSLQTAMAGSSFCDSKCAVRCSKAGVQDRCLKYCGICCEKCHCVPSGTYGHKDECPCYRDLKNSKGKSKCP